MLHSTVHSRLVRWTIHLQHARLCPSLRGEFINIQTSAYEQIVNEIIRFRFSLCAFSRMFDHMRGKL